MMMCTHAPCTGASSAIMWVFSKAEELGASSVAWKTNMPFDFEGVALAGTEDHLQPRDSCHCKS